MDKKKLMLLLGAMVVAIGTALAARSLLAGASTPTVQAMAPAPKGPRVLVAQRALPVGTIITMDSVNFQAWPKDMVRDAYFLDGAVNMDKLMGTVVRFPITAGQPLTQGALVAPGDRGFLAAALAPGMRAITIVVSESTGGIGFIFPGDHVDVMLTQSVRANYSVGDVRPLNATETILRNLRVLATDQSTETETVNGKSVVRVARTVTLEATPRMAEKIQVAQTIGSINLTLRSLAENQAEMEKAIASGALTLPEGASKATEDKLVGAAMSRPMDGATSFVTGGDVSRFQRKSMPATTPPTPKAVVNAFADRMGIPKRGLIAGAGDQVRITRGKEVEQVSAGSRGTSAPVATGMFGRPAGQSNPFEGQ